MVSQCRLRTPGSKTFPSKCIFFPVAPAPHQGAGATGSGSARLSNGCSLKPESVRPIRVLSRKTTASLLDPLGSRLRSPALQDPGRSTTVPRKRRRLIPREPGPFIKRSITDRLPNEWADRLSKRQTPTAINYPRFRLHRNAVVPAVVFFRGFTPNPSEHLLTPCVEDPSRLLWPLFNGRVCR